MASAQAPSVRSTAPRRPASGSPIRWDRVGRVALLVVLAGLVLLYVGPARSYISTFKESKARRAEVLSLERENSKLLGRRAALGRPDAVEREARRLGMVKPGERAYVVRGLPKGG
jgi:cell division protein FtsB